MTHKQVCRAKAKRREFWKVLNSENLASLRLSFISTLESVLTLKGYYQERFNSKGRLIFKKVPGS